MPETLEATGTEGSDERSPEKASPGGTARRRRRRIWLFVLLGVVLLVLALAATVADAYYQSYRIYRDARPIIAHLNRARASLSRGLVPRGDPFTAASGAADRARRAVDGARFTFRLTGALPYLGRPVKAARLGVAAAEEEARAARIMRDMVVAALGPAAFPGVGAPGQPPAAPAIPIFHDGTIDVKLIESFAPGLRSLVGHLRTGDGYIRAIPSVPFFHRLGSLKAEALGQSAKAIKLANDALSAVQVLPSFLGADGPKTYYLGLENNADQRATGGDVLAYAVIRVDRGRLTLLKGGATPDFEPPHGFQGVTLPSEYAWYLVHQPLTFPRLSNSNYTPNFPVVAQAWAALLDKGKGIRIDGVVALDPFAVSALLGAHVLRIPAYSKPITAGNVVTVVENDQYRLTRKQQAVFPVQLIAAAWPAIAEPNPFLPTIHRLGRALREKHILLWSADPREEELLTQLRWDGGLHRQPGDYLYQVDNKLRANKVDFYTHTSIAYDVTVQPSGAIRATCTVTLTNRTPPGQPQPIVWKSVGALNRALISLFVPGDATLMSALPATGLPNHREQGAQVFIRIADASPGRAGSVRYTYTVPNVIQTTSAGRLYQLTVQHQPMVNPADLTVRVTLPAGETVRSAPGWTVRGNVATFRTVLTTDFVKRIVF